MLLLWPAAEYHYATFALPIARRLAVLIMAMAVPNAALAGTLVLAVGLAVRPRVVDENGVPVVGLRAWLTGLRPSRSPTGAATGPLRPVPADVPAG